MALTASHCAVEAAHSAPCCWIKVQSAIKEREENRVKEVT